MHKVLKITLFFYFCVLLTFCSKTKDSSKQLLVGTLIAPYYELLKEIGSPYIEVVSILEPNQMEESVDISAKKMGEIIHSTYYFSFGFYLDKMLEEKKILPKEVFIHLDKMVPLYKFAETSEIPIENKNDKNSVLNEFDPHFWMSPTYMMVMLQKAQDVFSQMDPEHSALYEKKAQKLIKKIRFLQAALQVTAKKMKNKKILVYHPSLGYLAKDLGLIQVAIESEGKEPSLKELTKIIKMIKQEKLTSLLLQAQFSESIVKSIEHETGIQIVKINPTSPDYIGELKQLNKILG